jgi:hypothetical protein
VKSKVNSWQGRLGTEHYLIYERHAVLGLLDLTTVSDLTGSYCCTNALLNDWRDADLQLPGKFHMSGSSTRFAELWKEWTSNGWTSIPAQLK